MRFFDEYDRFYKTTGTLLLPNRFQRRWEMIIARNADAFRGARVLDIASHDGRWTFAALKAGAAYVEGVEARPELVQRAMENFSHYQVGSSTYSFVCQDAVKYLAQDDLPEFDIVMNLGFFYHTMRHMEILENTARTNARLMIIDTDIAQVNESVIQVKLEDVNDFRNAIDHRYGGATAVPVGNVSRTALQQMLKYVGYECIELDWHKFITDFAECKDYEIRDRSTFLAKRRA